MVLCTKKFDIYICNSVKLYIYIYTYIRCHCHIHSIPCQYKEFYINGTSIKSPLEGQERHDLYPTLAMYFIGFELIIPLLKWMFNMSICAHIIISSNFTGLYFKISSFFINICTMKIIYIL